MKIRVELTKPTGHVTMGFTEYISCKLYYGDNGAYKICVMGCLRELVKVTCI